MSVLKREILIAFEVRSHRTSVFIYGFTRDDATLQLSLYTMLYADSSLGTMDRSLVFSFFFFRNPKIILFFQAAPKDKRELMAIRFLYALLHLAKINNAYG